MSRFRSATFLLVLLVFQAKAQFKNIKLDEPTGKQAFEPSIAISKKDPNNIVVTSAPNNIYYSTDGGLSWTKSKFDYQPGVAGGMIVIAGSKGNFYVMHRTTMSGSDHLVCHESGDGGKSWTSGEWIDDDAKRMSADQRWQRVSTDTKGNLYVTWTQSDKYASADTACHSNIYYSKSLNGKKWSTPLKISQANGKCLEDDYMTAGSSSAVSADGKVYAVWANKGKIFFDRSFSGGDMWLSTDIPIADQPGGWAFDVAGHKGTNGLPQLLVDYSKGPLSGNIYVCWSDQRNGKQDTEVWLLRSSNGGDNWTQPMKIMVGESANHQYYPCIAIDQVSGAICVLYYNRESADDLKTEVYLAYSMDAGNKFEHVKISESPFTPSEDIDIGHHIGLSVHKGIVAPVWTRVEDGKTSVWTTTIKLEDLVNQRAKK